MDVANSLSMLLPLQTAAATFALLMALGVLFNLMWQVGKRSYDQSNPNDLKPFEERRLLRLLQVIAYMFCIRLTLGFGVIVVSWLEPNFSQINLFLSALRLAVVGATTWLILQSSDLDSSLSWFELRRSRIGEIALGVLWGGLLALAIALVEQFFGWRQSIWSVAALTWNHLPSTLIFAMDAFSSAYMFQAYILRNLNRSFSFLASSLLSSTMFVYIHSATPGIPLLGLVALFVSGVLSCYMFKLSRSLWLPMAFNFSWSFFLGPVFAFPVRGLGVAAASVAELSKGPAWVIGGSYGPEGGLLGLLVFLVGLALAQGFTELPSVYAGPSLEQFRQCE